jgi:hypothetical protein
MRVLSTQMGFVMICVAAPAAREAAKKSAGVRRALVWVGVRLLGRVVLGSRGAEAEDAEEAACRARWRAMARSKRDLKKKKEAQLVALPRRFGVRPRYRAATGWLVRARERMRETVEGAVEWVVRWTGRVVALAYMTRLYGGQRGSTHSACAS